MCSCKRLLAGAGVGVDCGDDVERRCSGDRLRDSCGFEDRLQLSGADYCIDLWDAFLNLVAVALDQASGDDQLFRFAGRFVARHFEDGVDGLLLGGVDKAAGVDDQDFGVFWTRGEARAGAVEQAHHHLGVDEVFGAA